MTLSIASDGTPDGTEIRYDGEPLRYVRSIDVRLAVDEAVQADVKFDLVEVTRLDSEHVEFHGLEDIPTDALRQELARRSAGDPAYDPNSR